LKGAFDEDGRIEARSLRQREFAGRDEVEYAFIKRRIAQGV